MNGELGKGKFAIIDDRDTDIVDYNWHVANNGYAVCCKYIGNYKSESFLMHRMVMNPPSNLEVDHINHNKLDNRRSNLRIVDRTKNNLNRLNVAGVCWDKFRGKWRAYIKIKGKQTMKRFETQEEAVSFRIRLKEEFA